MERMIEMMSGSVLSKNLPDPLMMESDISEKNMVWKDFLSYINEHSHLNIRTLETTRQGANFHGSLFPYASKREMYL